MANELVKPITLGVAKVGIKGLRAAAVEAVKTINPLDRPNRYAIGFDDSGSMAGDKISDAKRGIANFLSACNPQETSASVFPFCAAEKDLTCIYDQINFYLGPIEGTGGTPLFQTAAKILETNVTRIIMFSDGAPDYGDPDVYKEPVIAKAIEKRVPIDCVYIGHGDNELLKELAERTGGYYMRFDNALTFSRQMKYLSPKYAALLANAEIKAKIERGETI